MTVAAPAQAAETRKDLVFAEVDGQSLKLDLYLPDQAEGSSLLVFIHGGGWQSGNKSNCSLDWLADEGYSVASISYRLTDRAIFPAQIHDCKAAVRWLRAHADQFGYRTDRIAVAGTSAGGMLAALMGTSGDVESLEGSVGNNLDQSSRVQAVIDYFGATDFILRSRTQPSRANAVGSVSYKLFGGAASEQVELATLASAVTHVTPDDPPMLVLHGLEDQTVLPDQSQRIEMVYREAGLPIKLVELPGAGHGGGEFFNEANRNIVITFLRNTLGND
ncbi:alpha/beta hydrolase [Roseiconus nitratireducens]|uniref:Alpha/beta hydrolase n=2 Tax=Roseiconus nitratireducens TaxID=2605748 RepID=A0A5M6DE47_9BACT|nr:alpha/beta hydrolase [Roseiconus nitratireducens]